MRLTLKIWRQADPHSDGRWVSYPTEDLDPNTPLIDVLEGLNQTLRQRAERPIAFEYECRRGLCGLCGFVIDGQAHGPRQHKAICQLTAADFRNGATVHMEPWRARALPLVSDLKVDKNALLRALQAASLDSLAATAKAAQPGTCIECGACVAACPNASAALFAGAGADRLDDGLRLHALLKSLDDDGFGTCSDHGHCADACPQAIDLGAIARLNRAFLKHLWA